MTHLPCQRHLFDLPDHVAYLDCAKMSPMLRVASEAGAAGLARKLHPWEVRAEHFFDEIEGVREKAGTLLGVAGDHVAFVPAVSYGLGVAARNLRCGPGQTIVLLAEDFPSVALTTLDLAERTGAQVRTVQRAAAGWTEALLDAIAADTAIVFAPQVHWMDGGLIDLEQVGVACRRVGAALVLDLTQSLGALPIDLAAVDPDFMVAASYKWLFGPYGTALLYVAERHWGGEPMEQGWAARQGAHDFRRLIPYQRAWADGARRFDMGERANFALLPALAEALRWLYDCRPDRIAVELQAKTDRLQAALAPLGIAPRAGQRAPHFLSVERDGGWPERLGAILAAAEVHVSLRGDLMRITPHLYNTQADEERLLEALAAV